MTDPRIAKLPHWAQELLLAKDRQIASLTAALEVATGSSERAGVAMADPFGHQVPVAFTQADRIRFALEGTFLTSAHTVDVRQSSEGGLDVQGTASLVVHPVAANRVRLTVQAG